jgi:hypothetical protein
VQVWRSGGLDVWRYGDLEVWRSAGHTGMEQQRSGDLEVRRRGLEVWRACRYGGLEVVEEVRGLEEVEGSGGSIVQL